MQSLIGALYCHIQFAVAWPASPQSWVSIEAKTLRDMLTQTSFAVSHDETRYALNGVLFAFQGKDVRALIDFRIAPDSPKKT